jgi:hypothetical protein
MKKLMTKFLFLIAITANLHAEEPVRIQFDTIDNSTKALSVVEVLGDARGSGILALMDGNVVVVTNSHNLLGKTSAMVTLPNRDVTYYTIKPFNYKRGIFGFQGMLKVIYDFPLSDVAILAVPEPQNVEQAALLYTTALSNGVFSSQQKAWIAGKNSLAIGETISAITQGRPQAINVLEGFKGDTVPDTFISGDEQPVWGIPVFAKPGVSGGGYYRGGVLTGLVTKISLAGEPIALATPFTKIAKLLYSPDPREKKFSWENGILVYETADKRITMNPLGNGWLGNGGELTEIDESKSGDSNPNYWRLQVNTLGGDRIITTWDPFVYRPGHFKVNNENISFIKVKTKSLFKTTEQFRIPTIASFLASEKKGEQQTLLQNNSLNLALLKEARLKIKPNINLGRLYNHDYRENYYKIYNLRYGNFNGAQLLKPMSKDKWAPAQKYNMWTGPRPIIEMDGRVELDDEGYFSNIPFSTKVSDSTLFDVKIPGMYLDSRATAYIKGPADLSQVTIKFTQGSRPTEIVLKPIEINSPNSIVFKSDDSAYRAIYIYANDDLTRLARIYIVSEKSLLEFWGN